MLSLEEKALVFGLDVQQGEASRQVFLIVAAKGIEAVAEHDPATDPVEPRSEYPHEKEMSCVERRGSSCGMILHSILQKVDLSRWILLDSCRRQVVESKEGLLVS